VAEAIVFGEVTTGASSDLERATALARRMVTEYGMSELGVVTLGSGDAGSKGESRSFSEETARQIDAEVRRLVDEAYARAREVIVEHRAVLDRIAHALLRSETLQGADLQCAFAGEPGSVHVAPTSEEQPAHRAAPLTPRLLPSAAMRISPDGRTT
jgi:cell division protease FtsH